MKPIGENFGDVLGDEFNAHQGGELGNSLTDFI
jgi:hypothetical protein